MVFDSIERAAEFVRNSFPHDPKVADALVENNIRKIKCDDICDDDYVSLGGKGGVTWAGLLSEGE